MSLLLHLVPCPYIHLSQVHIDKMGWCVWVTILSVWQRPCRVLLRSFQLSSRRRTQELDHSKAYQFLGCPCLVVGQLRYEADICPLISTRNNVCDFLHLFLNILKERIKWTYSVPDKSASNWKSGTSSRRFYNAKQVPEQRTTKMNTVVRLSFVLSIWQTKCSCMACEWSSCADAADAKYAHCLRRVQRQ